MPISRLWAALLALSSLLLIVSPAAAATQPRLALVLANGAYGPEIGALANPVNDGILIADALKAIGFDVTLVADVDQRDMKRAIGDFGAALADAGPEAVGLFYYAGHGVQVAGTNYLVPVGAVMKREADVDLEAVDMETVLKQMEFAGVRINIVILDACRNNPLARSVRSAQSGLARMDAPIGSFIAYSTAPGSVAQDGTGGNSPFAAALAAEMRQPDLAIEDVFRRVRVSVKDATQGQQVPWDSSSLTDGFVFNPAGGPAAEDSIASAGDSGQQAEIAYWQSVAGSNDAAAIALYLKKYPGGMYADLAQLQLEKLTDNEAGAAPRDTAELKRQDFPEKDFAGLPRDLRPDPAIVRALREQAVFQSFPPSRAYRATLAYRLRKEGNLRDEVVTVRPQSGGVAHVRRDIVDAAPWDGEPGKYRIETTEELLVIGTLNLTAAATGKETRPGRETPIYYGGRVRSVATAEGAFFPVEDGAWFEVGYAWENQSGEPVAMTMLSKVGEDFPCSEVHADLPGHCFVVNSVAKDDSGAARRAFWTMVFVEEWAAFLPWGDFGTEDLAEGSVSVTKVELLTE